MQETTLNNSTDFSVPQRQSPAAIIILMLRSAVVIGKTLWPALLVMLFRTKKENESGKIFLILLGFGVLTIAVTLIKYFFYRFYIKDNNLVIKTGWLKKKVLNIPLQSIQAVHLEQNIWQQAFGVYKVSFDSAGSEKVEARIDALAATKAEQLKELLLSHTGISITNIPNEFKETATVYKLSAADLIKLSLSANHLEAFLILLAVSMNLVDDLRKAFNFDGKGLLEKYADSIKQQMVLVVTVMLLLVAVISVLFSVVRTVLRYFDFTLTDINRSWKISFGLLNLQQKIIPYNKIQVFSWHTNWLRRRINFWLLDVQTIGHLKTKERQRSKIPLTSKEAAVALAGAYQQTKVFDPAGGEQIHQSFWQRQILFIGVPFTVITTATIAILAGWQSLWAMLLLPYFVWYFYTWYKNFRWKANQEGLQTYRGVWGRRFTLIVWSKVQQVKMTQSPYQLSHQLASITFITAGGHVKLQYISLATASYLTNFVLYLIESRNEKWM